MKAVFLLLLGVMFTFSVHLSAATPPELLAAEKLQNDGNVKEAAEALKQVLVMKELAPATRALALTRAVRSLCDLEQGDAAAELIETEAGKAGADWHVLLAAGRAYGMLPSYGRVDAGKFRRGHSGSGAYASSEQRDRIRRLQLLLAGRKALPTSATPEQRGDALFSLVEAWFGEGPNHPGAAWHLQVKTDLAVLPEIHEDEDDEDFGGDASGFPVTATGEPVVFAVAGDYDTARNDGERLRLALKEWATVSPANAVAAQALWASLLRQWFSVIHVSHFLGSDEGDREAMQRQSLAAVHTLTDDETVAMLATGPKRITLPPEYRFMSLLKALDVEAAKGKVHAGEVGDFGKDWLRGYQEERIGELMQRRQYPQASKQIRALLAAEKDLDAMKGLTDRIAQIEGNWGRFEEAKSQPAGTKAKLPLRFRNATQVDCTAQRIDVAMLMDDLHASAKKNPEEIQLDLISHLSEHGAGEYAIGESQSWSTKLSPAPNHWDKQQGLETPLSEAGAYLVEGSFNGENPTRVLLWIESLTTVVTPMNEDTLLYVCDAVTGAPMPKAKLEFYGYHRDWRGDKPKHEFKRFSDRADAAGLLRLNPKKLGEYEWQGLIMSADGRVAMLQRGVLHGNRYNRRVSPTVPSERTPFFGITDRPVYRPGQEVKWHFISRRTGYTEQLDTNPYSGQSCTVTISDPRNEKLFEKILKFDDWGTIVHALSLPAEATLGRYSVQVLQQDRSTSIFYFSVEEYKKPEFEVKVESPDKPVALGESFEFTVKASYYFGGAIKEGKVRYTVKRHAHQDRWFPLGRWDWLYGKGYGWQTLMYDWYPGASSWCICMPPWHQWRHDPDETITEGEVVIPADGILKIPVDTSAAKQVHADQDHVYELDVTVVDSSRRHIDGSGSVIAARRPFQINAWANQGYYRVGDAGVLHFASRMLDGKEVKASGNLRVFSVSYDAEGKPKEEQTFESVIKTGQDQAELHWPKAGQYRLELKLKDEGGREVVTSVFVTVRGDDFDGRSFRFDDLELLVEKEEYQPGEEVELLINTNREGSTVALFVYGQQAPPVFVTVPGKSLAYRFKLRPEDQPNLNLSAFTVSNARLVTAQKKIIIPPNQRIATVELKTNAPTYKPREKAKTTLLVKDQHGQPFVGKVVLTAYDKALEYIAASNVGDIRETFWGWTNQSQVNHASSLQELVRLRAKEGEVGMSILSDTDRFMPGFAGAMGGIGGGGDVMRSGKSAMMPMAAMAPAPMAEGAIVGTSAGSGVSADISPGGAPPPTPMIRSNLADSAVWVTDITTNEVGEAVIDFDLPDNLTTWKIRSWVLGKDAQVGEASVEIITRQNLMVRLQAPRFFVEKDEITLSAIIHNETDKPLVIRPELSISPAKAMATLVPDGDRKAPITLAAHAEQRVDWRMKVVTPGEVTITAKALSETDSDAMRMTFPVYEHGALKTDAWSLALRADQPAGKIQFTVPEQRKPESSRLEIRWSPSLAMACIDALPYLADYPYGCTEQTLNRFVPTVLTLNLLEQLGVDLKTVRDKLTNLNAQEIGKAAERSKRWQQEDRRGRLRDAVFDKNKVERMARAGLQKLESMRNDDGSWGWFPGGRESSVHITALVTHGLLQAKAAKVAIDEDLISDALDWLASHETRELAKMKLDPKHRDHKSGPDDIDALVHCVLVEATEGDAAMADVLFEKRLSLSRLNLARLGIAFHQTQRVERRDMCQRNLMQFLKQDEENQTAWLDLPASGRWFWWGDEMETQATFLKLLSLTDGKGATAAGLAKYLLNNRKNGTWWSSTRDTATVVEALVAYAIASGESQPTMTVEVLLDGVIKKTVTITPETLFTFDNTLVLEGADVTTGTHSLELRKQGAGPLYANAYLTVYSKEDNSPAAGQEVKVERRYYKITKADKASTVAGADGNAARQKGKDTQRTELKSGAPVKSGDEIEVELILESKNDYEYVLLADPKPAGMEAMELTSGWTYDGLSAYQEFRDEKVAFFLQSLPQGRHTLRYRVRAEVPGKFSALPASAEAMYAPELRGNAAEWKAVITD
jgi:uncharacterized protein YfaS (alpha-2-macroglobulin family)